MCALCAGVRVSVYEGSGTSFSAGGIETCVLGEHHSVTCGHDGLIGMRVGEVGEFL